MANFSNVGTNNLKVGLGTNQANYPGDTTQLAQSVDTAIQAVRAEMAALTTTLLLPTDRAFTPTAGTATLSTDLSTDLAPGTWHFDALLIAQTALAQACLVGMQGGTWTGGIIGPAIAVGTNEGAGSWRSASGAVAGLVQFGAGVAAGNPASFKGTIVTSGGTVGLTIGRSNGTYQILLKAGSFIRLSKIA